MRGTQSVGDSVSVHCRGESGGRSWPVIARAVQGGLHVFPAWLRATLIAALTYNATFTLTAHQQYFEC